MHIFYPWLSARSRFSVFCNCNKSGIAWLLGAYRIHAAVRSAVVVIIGVQLFGLAQSAAHAREYPVQAIGLWKSGAPGNESYASAQAACAAACANTYCTPPAAEPRASQNSFVWLGATVKNAYSGACNAIYSGGPWVLPLARAVGCPWGGHVSTQGNCVAAPECPAGSTADDVTGQCGRPCPAGQMKDYTIDSVFFGQCVATKNQVNDGASCPNVADPINPLSGNKYQIEYDANPTANSALDFVRTYNSDTSSASVLGVGWRHNFQKQVNWLSGDVVQVVRGDGKVYLFSNVNGSYQAPHSDGLLQKLNHGAYWLYATDTGDFEKYDVHGNLVSVDSSSGTHLTLSYAAAHGNLLQVRDHTGRWLRFAYDANKRLASMTDSSGGIYTYRYDENNRLSSVQYPDMASRSYLYGETKFTGGSSQPNALTGIVDENNTRFATFAYDAQGRAILGQSGNVPGFQLAYGVDKTIVTDPLGTQRTYHFTARKGALMSTGISQPGGSGCMASTSAVAYDDHGNILSRDDFNGTRSCYAYDNKSQEIVRVEGLPANTNCDPLLAANAATPPGARKFTTTYHPNWRLPTQVVGATSQLITVFQGQPDPLNGNAPADCSAMPALPNGQVPPKVCKTIVRALASSGAVDTTVPDAINSYTYDAEGRLLTDTDANGNTSTYAYYTEASHTEASQTATASDQPAYWVGDLKSITDPAGNVSTFDLYSPTGQILQTTDPKGVVTQRSYTPRNWIATVLVTPPGMPSRTTRYSYDKVGQLTKIHAPDGTIINFSYDAAHRLIGATDGKGNRVTYTLDNMGNRIAEQTRDVSGNLQRSIARSFDALNRLQQFQGPAH